MPDSGQWSPGGGDPSLNEIRRVDRFFDALAADQHAYSTDSTEAELAFLLADWRDSIREPAVTTPVTARDAVAALQNGLHRKESRTSLTIVGSVAAALLCLGGFGTAIYAAGPNSSLYGLHTAMFGADKASRDDQVMLAAQTEMQQVQQLIDNGQWQQAQEKLQALSPTVQSVDTPEHKQQLIQQWNALTYKVVEQDPAATLPPPGEPMPVLPSSPLTLLPVPVVETTSSSTSSSGTSTATTSSTTSHLDRHVHDVDQRADLDLGADEHVWLVYLVERDVCDRDGEFVVGEQLDRDLDALVIDGHVRAVDRDRDRDVVHHRAVERARRHEPADRDGHPAGHGRAIADPGARADGHDCRPDCHSALGDHTGPDSPGCTADRGADDQGSAAGADPGAVGRDDDAGAVGFGIRIGIGTRAALT